MAYTKKADRVPVAKEIVRLIGDSADEYPFGDTQNGSETRVDERVAVGSPDRSQSDVERLTSLVQGLTAQVEALKGAPRPGTTLRKRTKEHNCTLREYSKEDQVLGIVTKLYDVKEVKDKSENKRFYGLCKLDIYNPRSKETDTIKDVDYLEFLNNAKKVSAKVSNWNKEQRFETDLRRGGGGTGPLVKQTNEREYISDANFEFEVGYVDHTFILEITDGEFEGLMISTDEKAINI